MLILRVLSQEDEARKAPESPARLATATRKSCNEELIRKLKVLVFPFLQPIIGFSDYTITKSKV